MTVEPFFQDETEEAMISQVRWIQKEFEIPDEFFANMLKIEDTVFAKWTNGEGKLPEAELEYLKEFWSTILHILSLLRFDLNAVRFLLLKEDSRMVSSCRLPFDPPWVGTSMISYLKKKGPAAISEVDHWVQSFRFGDP